MFRLASIDRVCAERVLDKWRSMVSTTLQHQDKDFSNLDEYMAFRIVDVEAYFTESMMLWGLGMQLTKQEDTELETLRVPWGATLVLTNDYFSYEQEYAERQRYGITRMNNAVWLCMRWHGIRLAEAKAMVRKQAYEYEQQLLSMTRAYREAHAPLTDKLDLYLRCLGHQVSGNLAWSLNCPRYSAAHRYDPNACLEKPVIRDERARTIVPDRKCRGNAEASAELEASTTTSYFDESASTNGDTNLWGPDEAKDNPNVSFDSDCAIQEYTLSLDEPIKTTLNPSLNQAPSHYVNSMHRRN